MICLESPMALEVPLQTWCQQHPLIADLVRHAPVTWFNPGVAPSA